MLILHYVTPSRRQEEGSVEITVCLEHSQSSCKYWKTSNQLDAHKTKRPHKLRYAVKGHSLSTHVCNGHQEVYTSLDTTNTRNVQTKNRLVYGRTGMTQSTAKWRVRCPAHPGTLFYQSTQQQLSQSPRQYPKRYVIHTRKRHIRSSNHYGNEPVTKPTHECGHNYEEQHQQSVSSNQYIVDLPISCQNARSCVTLLHTNQLTHCCSNHPSPAGKDQVQHTNIFSVGATAPALKEIFITRFSFHIFCVCILYTVKTRQRFCCLLEQTAALCSVLAAELLCLAHLFFSEAAAKLVPGKNQYHHSVLFCSVLVNPLFC